MASASLREVLQWMNANYAQKGRFFDDSDGVREAAETVSHADLGLVLREVCGRDRRNSRGTIFYAPSVCASKPSPSPFPIPVSSPRAISTAPCRSRGHTWQRGRPRRTCRLAIPILELQGKPAGQESRQELARLSPGDTLTVKVRGRRRGEREFKWKIGVRQEISYEVKDLDHVTAEQRARRAAWLKGEAQTANSSSEATGTAK